MANYEAQVCVIAAGPSGLSAAVQAAEDGAEVIVLEKAAAVREKAAQAKTAQSGGGEYTVTGEGDAEIDALVMKRYEAKKAKNFAEADRIRDELKGRGIEITDVKGGACWKRV